MSLPNNPLKQFFRRPAVFLTLPSGGKYYPEGVINQTETGELPVYPMTAIDEIATRTPDALFNGEAMIQVIQSCVPDILQPWSINSIDLDAILIAIRTASGDSNMEMQSGCPQCNEVNPYTLDLTSILPQLKCPNFEKTLDMNGLKIKFRPLTYKELNQVGIEQFSIQRTFGEIENIQDENVKAQKTKEALQVVTETTMKLVATAIEHIDIGNDNLVTDKNFIIDYLQNCDKNVYTQLRDYTAQLRDEAQIPPLQITCPNCSNVYQQPFTLNMSDFFG
jgi:hypothetical protein